MASWDTWMSVYRSLRIRAARLWALWGQKRQLFSFCSPYHWQHMCGTNEWNWLPFALKQNECSIFRTMMWVSTKLDSSWHFSRNRSRFGSRVPKASCMGEAYGVAGDPYCWLSQLWLGQAVQVFPVAHTRMSSPRSAHEPPLLGYQAPEVPELQTLFFF